MSASGEPGRVPEPTLRGRKTRRSALGRVLLSLFALFVLCGLVAAGAAFYGYTKFVADGPLQSNKIYMVQQGQGQQEIGAALEKEGIVSNGALFAVGAYAAGLAGQHLKPGEYEFPAGASMQQVLAIIGSGKAITYKITIPEGWTSQMAVARINENDVLTGDPVAAPAEGSIMPDTYVFRRGMTRSKLVDDMQAAQSKLLNQLWEERASDTLLKSKDEAVTLASIVEKETGVATERPMVASVFINRLKQGIRLQSDPTIIYGIVGGKGKLDRPLTKDDIAADTPYNTYRINGLPPGPIANPGRAAIEAVLNPPATSYVYFVANGTGGHAFATKLAEHNANVAKWRAIESGQATVVTTDAASNADAAASTGMPALPAAKVKGQPAAAPVAGAAEASAPVDAAAPVEANAPAAAAPVTEPAAGAGSAPPQADAAAAQPVPAPSSETTAPVVEAPAAAAQTEPPTPKAADTTTEAAAANPAAAAAPAAGAEPAPAPPKPQPKPADGAGAVAATTVLQPGTIVRVADQMVPIPRQKPKK